MITIKKEQADAAKEKFVELQTYRHLMANKTGGGISPTRLYSFMRGDVDDEVAAQLKVNLGLRRAYRNLLKSQAFFHVPEALAASTDEYPERHCDGCVVRLQVSRAQENQLYLIIELSDQRRNIPFTLSVFGSDESCEMLDLPDARNGVIQTIINRQSGLARLLADPKTEIFLR
ncbi:hypothetical protein [Terasakiella sp. SH-1]|uniref:hypothetical protein n=1 Tax=Terasakiella sp. SH-1 TaxID=2560057 RepID=UPI00107435AD|nr:hypothetical protein [Terasakiella sp. SH-1]